MREQTEWDAFKREDTRGVVEYYIVLAYHLMQRQRSVRSTPDEDLQLMHEFWGKYHDAQDSIVVCLEIQQRLLY